MWLLEVKTGPRAKWLPLSLAPTERLSDRQMLGWMFIFRDCSWRTTEGDDMRADELIAPLRGRHAKLDAPAVLDRCEEAGVVVWAEGENLRVKGSPLDDSLRADLKRCKPELLKLLALAPAWDEAEAKDLEDKIRAAYVAVRPKLHPAEDDPFSIAGRNVCADILASISRAVAVRRIDLLRRRVDFALGWFGTLDKTLHDLRKPGGWHDNRKAMLAGANW